MVSTSGYRREIANSDDVVKWLQTPEFYHWDGNNGLPLNAQDIRVTHVSDIGTKLAKQAQLFWDSDLIVLSHGATTGECARPGSLRLDAHAAAICLRAFER